MSQNKTIEPLAVSVPTAAEIMGFKDTKTVRNLIHQGKLKSRKSGRIYLVLTQSIREYLGA